MSREGYSITAIVLSAGAGKRMNSSVPKQYMELKGAPVIVHTLRAFEDSRVDNIVLVVGAGEEEYCREAILERYSIQKVSTVVEGGKERYDSVYNGLSEIKDEGVVLIHDGARPFLEQDLIQRCIDGAIRYRACAAAVPVKDTIKIVSEEGFAIETPSREMLWSMQTPQAFDKHLIWNAYRRMKEHSESGACVTDDAMVVERNTEVLVKIIPASYTNMKITTPEDILLGEMMLSRILGVTDFSAPIESNHGK